MDKNAQQSNSKKIANDAMIVLTSVYGDMTKLHHEIVEQGTRIYVGIFNNCTPITPGIAICKINSQVENFSHILGSIGSEHVRSMPISQQTVEEFCLTLSTLIEFHVNACYELMQQQATQTPINNGATSWGSVTFGSAAQWCEAYNKLQNSLKGGWVDHSVGYVTNNPFNMQSTAPLANTLEKVSMHNNYQPLPEIMAGNSMTISKEANTIHLQAHYDNSNGSLYQISQQRKWNTYLFDVVKRLERFDKKDQPIVEILKSIGVLTLQINEQDIHIGDSHEELINKTLTALVKTLAPKDVIVFNEKELDKHVENAILAYVEKQKVAQSYQGGR